jgi:hypothetical protein
VVVAPIAVAILVGLVAGALRRGRLATLARTRLRRPVLLALAVACALAADVLDLPAPAVFAFVGLLAGIWFAASNLLIPGMFVVGIGVVANLVPVALNGAMPVRGEALVDASLVAESDLERVELSGARELADSDTTLEVLGDVIPVPQFDQVVSFGDLIILVGLADVIANLMRARRPARLPRGAGATLIALGWDVPPDDDIFIDLRTSLDQDLTRPRPGDVTRPSGPAPGRPRATTSTRPVASPEPAGVRSTPGRAGDSVSALTVTEPW